MITLKMLKNKLKLKVYKWRRKVAERKLRKFMYSDTDAKTFVYWTEQLVKYDYMRSKH